MYQGLIGRLKTVYTQNLTLLKIVDVPINGFFIFQCIEKRLLILSLEMFHSCSDQRGVIRLLFDS